MKNPKRRTRKKQGGEHEITSISMPKPMFKDVVAVANEEFEGNISRYVRSLVKASLKGKAA